MVFVSVLDNAMPAEYSNVADGNLNTRRSIFVALPVDLGLF